MTDLAKTPAEAPPGPVPAGGGAPAVVAVIVTHDPGPWFEDVLRSLKAQSYEALSVLVVDAASAEDPSGRVASVLPGARIKRVEENVGYGAAANQVIGLVEGAAFYLLLHDDVALEPGAIRALVEEAFRTNGGVLGPKLVDWHDPRRLRSVGGAVDKTAAVAPFAEPGELDQEQHDAVRDVFYVAGGAILVRADLFGVLGGFDPGISFHGDDVDLCWRAHVAGARVLIVPSARARHLEALGVRRPEDDRRRLQQRHRVRTLLSTYRAPHLVRVLPQAFLLTVLEAIGALATGRIAHTRDVVAAWTWNLRRLPALRRRRKFVNRARVVSDAEVRDLQVRGSARLTAFLRGQVGSADDRLAGLAATGRDLTGVLRAPLTRVAISAALATVLMVVLGSRGLAVQRIPAVGELAATPGSALDLLRAHLSGWRATAGGGVGASPTGIGALGLASFLTLGSTELTRTLVILGLLAAGPVGIWRLTRPIGSIRAGAAAVVVYAAIPLPYNALATGALSALAAYATVPWVLLGLGRAMGLAPFGRTDLPDDAEVVIDSATSVPARALGIGLAVALAGIVTPAAAALTLLVVVGLVVGSLVAGRAGGVLKALTAGVGGVAVAVVLHLPWSWSLLADGGDWDAVVRAGQSPSRPLGELLRFQTGPHGNSPLGWAFLVAAALPLVIGRGWRLAWAIRAWFVALASWTVLLVAEQGHLPVGLPPTEMILVPAAAGLALSAALGMAAFEVDLRHYQFGWRQGVSILAAGAVVVGGLTLVPGVIDGRWKVAGNDLNRFVETTLGTERDARVLWVGDRTVMPLGGHGFDDDVSLATSEGAPDVATLWAGARQPSTDRLDHLLTVAAEGRTSHLGSLLAAEGIRYVMVPTRSVPSAYAGREAPPPAWLTDLLAAQVDLQRVDTDASLIVYRNTAWRDVVHTVPDGEVLADTPDGAGRAVTDGWDDVMTRRDGTDGYDVDVPAGVDLVAAVPADGWSLDVPGGQGGPTEAYGWAARFDDPGTGTGTLSFQTPTSHVVGVVVQPLLWVLALVLRSRILARARRRAEAARPAPSAPTPVVDPVEAAAAALAGLAQRAGGGDESRPEEPS